MRGPLVFFPSISPQRRVIIWVVSVLVVSRVALAFLIRALG